MLNLDSPVWSKLEHAYGSASNIPDLLHQLEDLPASEGENEPWFTLWSSLAHQGDVYSASFAAVPHVIHALSKSPTKADATYFQFPAWVEICRNKKTVPIPVDLEEPYFTALAKLPALVAEAAKEEWDSDQLSCALAAVAAAKGSPEVAEAILELDPKVAKDFMEWFLTR